MTPPRNQYRFVRRDRCPGCLCADGTTQFETPFVSGPVASFVRRYYRVNPELFGDALYQLVRCNNCTLLYQACVADPELLTELYGVWIANPDIPHEDPIYRRMIAHPLESRDGHEILTAAAFLGCPAKQLTTLDYGMGWALWARTAHLLGCRSFGTELVPARVEFARAHGVQCLTDEEIGPASFDFVNTEQVFEHLPNLRAAAERLAKALRPGGILKISVPSAEHVAPVLQALRRCDRALTDEEIMPVQPLEHVNSFTTKAIAVLAETLGLSIVKPSIIQRYAFLRVPGTMSTARAKEALKELIRPVYQWQSHGTSMRGCANGHDTTEPADWSVQELTKAPLVAGVYGCRIGRLRARAFRESGFGTFERVVYTCGSPIHSLFGVMNVS